MDENTKFSIKDYREMLYRNMNEIKKDEKKLIEEKSYCWIFPNSASKELKTGIWIFVL